MRTYREDELFEENKRLREALDGAQFSLLLAVTRMKENSIACDDFQEGYFKRDKILKGE